MTVREFVLKVEERCNLACTYCYMYELADQSYQDRPVRMSDDIIIAAAKAIGQYACDNCMDAYRVILHGGEPLLGAGRLGFIAQTLRAHAPLGCRVFISMQTNATLLTDDILGVMLQHGIGAGISIDGAEKDHDRHRKYANGRGSFDLVERGINRITQPQYRPLFRGLLCVVNIDADPLETYHSMLKYNPPAMDYLLPLLNHETPPVPGAPYGKWLAKVYDEWFDEWVPSVPTIVRMFSEIHRILDGQAPRSAVIGGGDPGNVLVIESDGSIEMLDALKSAFEGAAVTGVNVDDGGLIQDAVVYQDAYFKYSGVTGTCQTCSSCPILKTCGRGYFPHRWDGRSFLNTSAYCEDLKFLIAHIEGVYHGR